MAKRKNKKVEEPKGRSYFMTESMSQLFRTAPADIYAKMLGKLKYWINQYHQARLNNGSQNTAFNFHFMMDEATEDRIKEVAEAGEPVTCKVGCHFCCFNHIVITEDEGQLLLGYAAEEELTFNMDKIKAQAEYDGDTWTKQEYADRACTFLDPINKTCKVYKHRPASCRAHYVVSDPEKCNTKIINPEPARLVDLETNLLASAAMNASPTAGMSTILKRLLTPKTEENG